MRQADGTQIGAADIRLFKKEVESCSLALQKARSAWEQHCAAEVARHDLSNAPREKKWITEFLTKAVTGQDNLTFLKDPLNKLQEVIDYCQADIDALGQGGKATHFLKSTWYYKV